MKNESNKGNNKSYECTCQEHTSDAVQKEWCELRAFWNRYLDVLKATLPRCEEFTYENLRPSLARKLGIGCDKGEWKLDERSLAKFSREELEEYLKYVVHPDDLAWLLGNDDGGAPRLTDEDLLNMVQFLYSQVRPGNQATKTGASHDFYPCLPQPFYGSPLDARLVGIFNNPGYDDRTAKAEPDVASFEHTQMEQLARFRCNDSELTQPKLVPCVSDGGYYQPKYNPKTGKNWEYLLQNWSGGRHDPNCESALAKRIFHADLCPYQSRDKNSPFMKAIWAENEAGAWMPSQEALLTLLKTLMISETRILVFRSSERMKTVHEWLSHNDLREDLFERQAFRILSPQDAGMRFSNIGKELVSPLFHDTVERALSDRDAPRE